MLSIIQINNSYLSDTLIQVVFSKSMKITWVCRVEFEHAFLKTKEVQINYFQIAQENLLDYLLITFIKKVLSKFRLRSNACVFASQKQFSRQQNKRFGWLLITKPYCLVGMQSKSENSGSKLHWINYFCPELNWVYKRLVIRDW